MAIQFPNAPFTLDEQIENKKNEIQILNETQQALQTLVICIIVIIAANISGMSGSLSARHLGIINITFASIISCMFFREGPKLKTIMLIALFVVSFLAVSILAIKGYVSSFELGAGVICSPLLFLSCAAIVKSFLEWKKKNVQKAIFESQLKQLEIEKEIEKAKNALENAGLSKELLIKIIGHTFFVSSIEDRDAVYLQAERDLRDSIRTFRNDHGDQLWDQFKKVFIDEYGNHFASIFNRFEQRNR